MNKEAESRECVSRETAEATTKVVWNRGLRRKTLRLRCREALDQEAKAVGVWPSQLVDALFDDWRRRGTVLDLSRFSR
jgi:hypothetical protein